MDFLTRRTDRQSRSFFTKVSKCSIGVIDAYPVAACLHTAAHCKLNRRHDLLRHKITATHFQSLVKAMLLGVAKQANAQCQFFTVSPRTVNFSMYDATACLDPITKALSFCSLVILLDGSLCIIFQGLVPLSIISP